jgi:hypothetical protein
LNTINFIYLRADLAAQRSITKPARVEKKKHKQTKTRTQAKNVNANKMMIPIKEIKVT